jgi:hypothetical protein
MSSPFLRQQIEELFAEALAQSPGHPPVLECAITFVGGYLAIQGSLSQVMGARPGLRLLSQDPNGPAPGIRRIPESVQMFEHFFDYDAVLAISIHRTVTLETPRIVTA